MNNNAISIEERISVRSTISEALQEMKEFKNWSDTTFISYRNDVLQFEEFLCENKLDPLLENGKLHHIQRWIKHQREQGVAYSTVKRRIASLSSIFSFYRDLGVVQQNCFKAADVPLGNQEHHSRILEVDELHKVYKYANELKKTVYSHISPTIKMLIFTGLRNEALTGLRVEQVNFEKSLLHVNVHSETINSKHKVQIIPLPPNLLKELEQHIKEHQLRPQDKLLFGLAGQPLAEKALNRLTNRISIELGWDNHRVTPHGFRATISTILSERGVELAAIKFLLGHSEQDNIQFYIRRYGRHIRLLHRELTRIEEELSQESNTISDIQDTDATGETEKKTTEMTHKLPKELLLKLLDTDPELAIIMIQKGLAHV